MVENEEKLSPRRHVTRVAKELWKQQRQTAYRKVKRGPINWALFPFDKFDRAVAILVDESDLFSNPLTGVKTMTMTFEIFAKIREVEETDDMDDGLLDEFYDDVRDVVVGMEKATYSDGKTPVILDRKKGAGQSLAVEAHDTDLGVQGLIASVRLDY